MGGSESKCSDLLTRMGWERPAYIGEFYHSGLTSYLGDQNLEVVLPRHAPQADLSCADRKPREYPRPNFCWEGYKMHLALIGPSTACKNQFTSFLPKIADVFQGVPSRLGPGRNATPYYFMDEELHKMVLWELPEMTYRQSCEDYIREIGLMYIDCVFMLFSDKYLLTESYCKLAVAMAIHGIPFFVICTMSGEELDQKAWDRLKTDFQKKDIIVRMFRPSAPQESVEDLINEFFKHVAWNRSYSEEKLTRDIRGDILGQTVRLKNLEKKPELNGRCGVCIGFDKEQSRYRVRIITSGVESDLAIREDCMSVLKPKLLESLVRIKGLESKPELNGRYGFVDEFLRENERYRVFVPDVPGKGLAIALKPANLDKVDQASDARPVPRSKDTGRPAKPAQRSGQPASAAQARPKANLPKSAPSAPAPAAPKAPAAAPVVSPGTASSFDPPAREKPVQRAADSARTSNSTPSSFSGSQQHAAAASAPARPAARKPASSAFQNFSRLDGSKDGNLQSFLPQGTASSSAGHGQRWMPTQARSTKPARADDSEDDDIASLLPKLQPREEESGDLMSRIRAAEADAGDLSAIFVNAAQDVQAQQQEQQSDAGADKPEDVRLQFSRAGLLAMGVWAIMGNAEIAEDVADHLMDCSKVIFTVGSHRGAHYETVAGLDADPTAPRVEVLAFLDGDSAALEAAIDAAVRLGVRGAILHPGAEAYDSGILQRCIDLGFVVHGADIFEALVPGTGLPVAPLD